MGAEISFLEARLLYSSILLYDNFISKSLSFLDTQFPKTTQHFSRVSSSAVRIDCSRSEVEITQCPL